MPSAPVYAIEVLGDHDRASFRCGVTELDDYFHYQARQDARRKVAAPFVLVDERREILGFYTLSAYAVHLTDMPEELVRKLPKYPLLPATLLGRLAISEAHRGKNLGQLLLIDALRRSWRHTGEVASIGVVVEALDESARQFYLRHEFVQLLDHPEKLFISMQTIAKLFPYLKQAFISSFDRRFFASMR